MADILEVFREKTESLIASINSKGGLRATINSLRRQMEQADRRRAMSKIRTELKHLNRQIDELIMAVGVQAVGFHQAGRLNSPELQPLCQHVVELKSTLEQQEAELARLEAMSASVDSEDHCVHCGKRLPQQATFCPSCGMRVPQKEKRRCTGCGAVLRPQARFCAQCGRPVE